MVEGFNTRYITGSGSSSKTKRRVYMYEREGCVNALRRIKAKRQVSSSVDDCENGIKRMKCKAEPVPSLYHHIIAPQTNCLDNP